MEVAKSLPGKTMTLWAEAWDTIDDIKKDFRERRNATKFSQRLIFAGRQPENGRPLNDCGIGPTQHCISSFVSEDVDPAARTMRMAMHTSP